MKTYDVKTILMSLALLPFSSLTAAENKEPGPSQYSQQKHSKNFGTLIKLANQQVGDRVNSLFYFNQEKFPSSEDNIKTFEGPNALDMAFHSLLGDPSVISRRFKGEKGSMDATLIQFTGNLSNQVLLYLEKSLSIIQEALKAGEDNPYEKAFLEKDTPLTPYLKALEDFRKNLESFLHDYQSDDFGSLFKELAQFESNANNGKRIFFDVKILRKNILEKTGPDMGKIKKIIDSLKVIQGLSEKLEAFYETNNLTSIAGACIKELDVGRKGYMDAVNKMHAVVEKWHDIIESFVAPFNPMNTYYGKTASLPSFSEVIDVGLAPFEAIVRMENTLQSSSNDNKKAENEEKMPEKAIRKSSGGK